MSGLPIVPSADLGEMLVYAVRYAIGRQSYAVDDVCGLVRKYWRDIPQQDRGTLEVDVGDAVDGRNPVPIIEQWAALHRFIKAGGE